MLTQEVHSTHVNGSTSSTKVSVRDDAATSVVVQRDVQESLLELAVRMATRYWIPVLVGMAISAVLAFVAAQKAATTKATLRARAVYVPLPKLPGSDSFRALDTGSVVGLMKSTKCLNHLAQQFQLSSATGLSHGLQVSAETGSPYIDLALTWTDPEQGAELLNGAIHVAADELTSQTKKTLEQYVQVTQASLKSADALVEEARTALAEFYSDNPSAIPTGSGDATADIATMSLATQASHAELRHTNLVAKESLVREQLDQLQVDLRKELLAACRDRIDSIRGVAANTQVAQDHVETLLQQFHGLESANEQSFDDWKADLLSLVRRVFGAGGESLQNQILLAEKKILTLQTQMEKLTIDESLAAAELENLRRRLESETSGVDGTDGRGTANPTADHEVLKSNLSLKMRSRGVMADRLKALRELQQSDHEGLSVLEPANPSFAVEKSSWKKIFVLTFTSGMALLCCGVLLYEERHSNASAGKVVASRLGLPAAGSLSSGFPESESNRLFALRFRRSVPQAHAVVLFAGVTSGVDHLVDKLITLARNLARGGDRVLVVDASRGVTTGGTRGGQMLRGVSPQHSECELVDLIEIGDETPWAASYRLDSVSVVDHLRDGYEFVLIAGPTLQSAADVEVLSATSDAVFLCVGKQRYVDPSIRQSVLELRQNVSVLGLVQMT